MRKLRTMSHLARPVTADEFARIPDDDWRYELVEGRIVRMSPVGGQHGVLAVRIAAALEGWVRAHSAGVVGVEIGFKLASNPDTVRGPDVAFVSRQRVPVPGVPTGFWDGPPDLAVEVLSPDDRQSEMRAKVDEYLVHGVRLVWVIDSDDRTVAVYRRGALPVHLESEHELCDDDILPGFRLAIDSLFT